MRPAHRLWVIAAALGWTTCIRGTQRITARKAEIGASPASVGVLRCWPQGGSEESCSVTVLGADGRSLPHQVVWWRKGDPLDLRFDCSGDVESVYVRIEPNASGGHTSGEPAWEGRAGVLLETRPRVSDAVESWPAVQAQWRQAGAPLGRGEALRIFDGLHRFGPTTDFLSHYRGWFGVEKTGRCGFATISDDASFLFVDGALVAEWPGWHGVEGGRRGEHHGWIQLEAGIHRMDYYNAQDAGGFQVAVAWRPADRDAFEVMPEEAFVPTTRFEVEGIEGCPDGIAFRWETAAHVRTGAARLIEMTFATLVPAAKDTLFRWTFPDGVVREGAHVAHVFCGDGVLPVTLEKRMGGRRTGASTVKVRVKPDWSQRAEFDPAEYRRMRSLMTGREVAHLTTDALADWVRWADAVDDAALLTRLGDAVLDHLRRWEAKDADALYRLGFHFQIPSLRRYGDARRTWSALLALQAADSAMRGRAALHCGGMELHAAGNVAAAERLFAEAEGLLPPGDDHRLLAIYRGDAAILAGRADIAREAYWRAGTVVTPGNTHYEVRRAERLERARRHLADDEHDAVAHVVRELEWERPMERMGLATGLLLAQAQAGRGETEFALGTLRRLRGAGQGDSLRPEFLRFASELFRGSGAAEEGAAAAEELRRLYPYSEAAAWLPEQSEGAGTAQP